MKSKKLILVVAAAAMAFASQHANAQWQLTGNAGTDTAVNFVGTTNNTGFKIKTNNIDRVWVGTNGRVGINTVAPVNNLDVVNNGAVTMGIRSNTAGATMSMDRGLATANAAFAYKSLGVVLWNSGILSNDNFTIRNAAAGTNAMVITPANNVGIGTGTPSQKLDVNGSINANGVMYATGGNSTNWNSAYGWGNHATAGYITSESDPQVGANTLGYVPRWDGSALTSGAIYDNGLGKVGIGTTNPIYSLDISGSLAFAQIKATSSWAGLIIDKGASTDNGYVIHRSGGSDLWTEGTIGNNNFCLRNWPLGLSAFTVSASNNFIGIGTATPSYLVDVQGNTAGTSYYNINSTVNYVGTSDIRAIYGTSHPADGYGYGIQTYAGYYGGSFICNDGAYGFGVGAYGQATGTTGTQYGVYGYAAGGTTNYAVYASGLTYSTGGYSSSDAKLKKGIREIDNALDKINQLQPRTYTFKTDEYKYMGLPGEQQYGFIAQELEQVFPEMVKEVQQPIDNDYKKNGMLTFKAINYTEIIPVLTKAIQEQQKQIEVKDAKIAEQQVQLNAVVARLDMIEKSLSQCCTNYEPSNEKQSGLSNTDAARLEQNQPNPFNQSSIIKFYVPSAYRTAQIIITDIKGIQLKQFNIEQSGIGQITINGSELASGSYLYSLVIDNLKVDTKKMELTK